MVREKIRKETTLWLVPTRISVRDLGPIEQADIELRPLTVLMGPNNTGKTYIATLLPVADRIINMLHFYHAVLKKLREKVDEETFLKQNIGQILIKFYSVNILSELIRKGYESAEINFSFKEANKLTEVFHDVKIIITKDNNLSIKTFRTSRLPRMHRVVYIPAERAGIMRTYKQLLRLRLESLPPLLPPHLERKQIMKEIMGRIRLPGLVEVLLDQILSIDKFTSSERAKSKFGPALRLLEDEVLQGVVELGEDLSVTYTEKRIGQPIDLVNTSSMISEVSAIYVLTSMLRSNSWFVIEEPEAHVHPRGQMGIARFLAALVRVGVNTVITTHSDLIALKLANLVGLAKLKESERESLGYRPDEYLRKEDLSLYFMELGEKGSVAKRIETSETGEVEELPTYSKVVEEMYGEAVKLLELHGKIPTLHSTE